MAIQKGTQRSFYSELATILQPDEVSKTPKMHGELSLACRRLLPQSWLDSLYHPPLNQRLAAGLWGWAGKLRRGLAFQTAMANPAFHVLFSSLGKIPKPKKHVQVFSGGSNQTPRFSERWCEMVCATIQVGWPAQFCDRGSSSSM